VGRFPWAKISIAFLLLLLILAVAPKIWLPWLGYPLIHDDGPAKADIAVVLAGDSYGHRIEAAAELVKQGYVPAVLVSGPYTYGIHESDLAINMMVRHGYPAQWFLPLPNDTHSTREEARAVLSDLRNRNVHSFLLVTSNYHSRRAASIFRAAERKMGGGPTFRVVTARDEYFSPDSWWRNREGQKTVLLEWTKTFATALGQ
jgi:uncharacterized SAM-binding protein YcdF (DUF218 family)